MNGGISQRVIQALIKNTQINRIKETKLLPAWCRKDLQAQQF